MASSAGSIVMNELQKLQLRAQILVYGALLQNVLPEEQLMVGAFSDTSTDESCWNDGRHMWEEKWLKFKERVRQGALVDVSTVPSMPTAVRSALNPVQATAPLSNEEDVEEARGRKKSKDSPDEQQLEKRLELDVQQVKRYLENAETVVSSVSTIVERTEAVRAQFQGRTSYGQMTSITIAVEAALSAATAAVAAASLAYKAAQRASSSPAAVITTGTTDCLEDDEEGPCEEMSCALGNVFKAVSQAQTALRVDNPRQLCASWRRDDGQLNGGHNQMDSALLTEGATVEVMARRPGAWFTAKVLSVKDGSAHVAYNDLVDEGNNHVTEWVSSDLRSCQPPKIRFPYPSFDLNEEHDEEPKRWTVGDHIDAHVGHAWREGIVVCVKSDDVEVFYPSENALDSVKSSDIRPSLLWQGNKWALWKCLHLHELEKEAASSPDFELEIVAEHGTEENHKINKLADVIIEADGTDENSKRLGATKRVRSHAELPTEVSKAKRLTERSGKPSGFQLPDPQLAEHVLRVVTPSSTVTLKQLARIKGPPKKEGSHVTHSEEPKVIQPSSKLLEELKTALQGGIL